ncbi:hypothetical protein [Yersinia bercovieri]|uniref:hypothetical protein n=1 Tax=Yersinia bercovieri TaxID=634 RepID=UPI001643DD10|nr:hypothetical protein [Yersinia bercovieri]
MKLNKLDDSGFYIVDHIEDEGPLPQHWTRDLVGNGYYKAQYQGATQNPQTGEWTGGTWAETSGPSLEDIEYLGKMISMAERDENQELYNILKKHIPFRNYFFRTDTMEK